MCELQRRYYVMTKPPCAAHCGWCWSWNLHCKEAIMFCSLYEFQRGLILILLHAHRFPRICLSVELISHTVLSMSDSLPRGSDDGHFPLQCTVSWTLLPICPLCYAALCSLFDCAASFLCIAGAAARCWQRRWLARANSAVTPARQTWAFIVTGFWSSACPVTC